METSTPTLDERLTQFKEQLAVGMLPEKPADTLLESNLVSWPTACQLRDIGFAHHAAFTYIRKTDSTEEPMLTAGIRTQWAGWEHVPAYQLHELLTGLVVSRQTGEYINVKLNIAAVSMIGLTSEPICSLNYGPMGVDGLPDNWAEGLARLIIETHQRRQALEPKTASLTT